MGWGICPPAPDKKFDTLELKFAKMNFVFILALNSSKKRLNHVIFITKKNKYSKT